MGPEYRILVIGQDCRFLLKRGPQIKHQVQKSPKKCVYLYSYVYACARESEPRPSSWIGKAGAGVFSVNGLFDGEWKNYVWVTCQVGLLPKPSSLPDSTGIIGSSLVLRLLDSKDSLSIVGLDNLNDYYDPSLMDYRLSVIQKKAAYAKASRQGAPFGRYMYEITINRDFARNSTRIVLK